MIAAKRTVAHVLQALDDLHFALGAKHRRVEMLLHLADFQRHRGALVQKGDELRVDRVDVFAQRLES